MTALCLICMAAMAAAEQPPSLVEAEGYAAITGGRKDLAREAALQNAFRRAVEQVVGVAVESRTVVKDAELLNDKIFSKSRGFIKTYRITGERAESDAYRVTVQAAVSRYRLEKELDDVGLLIRKLGKPRVAVVVMEQNGDGPAAPGGIVETGLVGNFGKKGYALVDRQAMLAVEREAAKGHGDQSDAVIRAAAAGGAEVVITGQATARHGAAVGGTSLRPVQASVTCRAVDVDSGELLATVTSTQQALNVNPSAAGTEALHKAAAELSDSLNRQMVAAWNKRLTGLRTLRLTVAGLPFGEIPRIKDSLKEQMGQVEEVHERGYRDRQLRLDLEVTGSTRAVIDELATVDLGGNRLKISGFSAGHVQSSWSGQGKKGGKKP
jgi:hypothetical protein